MSWISRAGAAATAEAVVETFADRVEVVCIRFRYWSASTIVLTLAWIMPVYVESGVSTGPNASA